MVGQIGENDSTFYFTTDFGFKYTVSFMLEYSFVLSGGYQVLLHYIKEEDELSAHPLSFEDHL